MAPMRQVSHRQLQLLVEFAERNPSIALNSNRGGPLGHQRNEKAWEALAKTLNSLGDGSIKNAFGWKRYWGLFKCRTKTKAADIRRNQRGTGGGPNKLVPLTDVEEKVSSLIGPVAVEGDPEVRIPTNLYYDEIAGSQTEVVPYDSEEVTDHSEDNTAPLHVRAVPVQENEAVPLQAELMQVTSQPGDDGRSRPHTSAFLRQPPRRSNHDNNVPRWAYDLEERRIAAEERLADSVERIEGWLQTIAATQAQLMDLLQGRSNLPQ